MTTCEWVVYLASPEWMNEYEPKLHLHGLTMYSDGDVFIRSDDPIEVQDETLLHELIHVSRPDLGVTEEAVTGELSPKLFRTLVAVGMLRVPKRPPRWEKFLSNGTPRRLEWFRFDVPNGEHA